MASIPQQNPPPPMGFQSSGGYLQMMIPSQGTMMTQGPPMPSVISSSGRVLRDYARFVGYADTVVSSLEILLNICVVVNTADKFANRPEPEVFRYFLVFLAVCAIAFSIIELCFSCGLISATDAGGVTLHETLRQSQTWIKFSLVWVIYLFIYGLLGSVYGANIITMNYVAVFFRLIFILVVYLFCKDLKAMGVGGGIGSKFVEVIGLKQSRATTVATIPSTFGTAMQQVPVPVQQSEKAEMLI